MKPVLNKKSFTMAELAIVVIVVGVIAGLALPRYAVTVERARSAEGAQTLKTLLDAQYRFAAENDGAYQDGSGSGNLLVSGDLDVFISSSANFDVPKIFNNASDVARATRVRGGTALYRLDIDENGDISCTNLSGNTYCSKFGY